MAKHKGDLDETKTYAFLGVFLLVIGFIIVLLTRKNDKYAMFYAKQGLVLTIAWVIAAVIGIVPILGWILSPICLIIVIVLWIIGWVYSISGKKQYVPIVGKFADNLNV